MEVRLYSDDPYSEDGLVENFFGIYYASCPQGSNSN
jgi:hypothetical protein